MTMTTETGQVLRFAKLHRGAIDEAERMAMIQQVERQVRRRANGADAVAPLSQTRPKRLRYIYGRSVIAVWRGA